MMPGGRGDILTVDVVISNHDYGAFVTDAIESVRAQDHPNVHLVVVDDGSTDDSRERLRAHADAVEVILQPNRGQAAALNAGLAGCEGDIVMFLDADDVLRPGAVARGPNWLARRSTSASAPKIDDDTPGWSGRPKRLIFDSSRL